MIFFKPRTISRIAIIRTLLSLLFLGATAAAAPVPKELRRDPLVGQWDLRTVTFDRELIDRSSDGVVWNIDGVHALTVSVAKPAGEVPVAAVKAPLGWVMSSNGPDSVQLRFDTAHSNVEHGAGDQTRAGKYRLDGDTLTICLGFPGRPQPNTVDDPENAMVWTLKRAAK